MPDDHAGYLDFDGEFFRFQSARCCFASGELDVEAEGRKCKLRLYGVPFKDADSIADLEGKTFGPDEEIVGDDPIAEGGIETGNTWFCFEQLEVKCRSYDPDLNLVTVWFSADVRDNEFGRSGSVDCSVRCSIVDKLW